jgi:hypothetical protein
MSFTSVCSIAVILLIFMRAPRVCCWLCTSLLCLLVPVHVFVAPHARHDSDYQVLFCFSSCRMNSFTGKDMVLLSIANAIQTVNSVLVRSMVEDEVPFIVSLASIGTYVRKLQSTATGFSLDEFFNNSFTIDVSDMRQSDYKSTRSEID